MFEAVAWRILSYALTRLAAFVIALLLPNFTDCTGSLFVQLESRYVVVAAGSKYVAQQRRETAGSAGAVRTIVHEPVCSPITAAAKASASASPVLACKET